MRPGRKPNLLFLALLCLFACSHPRVFSRTQMMMGDVPVTITVRSEKREKEVFYAMEGAFQLAKEIEKTVSEFHPSSQLSLLNKEGVKSWIPLGKELIDILETGEKISVQTQGAFDMTFASSGENASYKDIELDLKRGKGRLRREGVVVGVSGIAKGYIVDQMSDSLSRQGFQDHLVNAGGDLRARGTWEVGIRDPHHKETELCHLTLKNQSASTSGRYERGDHIVDPRTKAKVRRGDLLSTTVIGPSTIETDALATAAFVLLPNEAEELFSQYPESTFFLVDSEVKVGRVGKGLDSISCSSYTAFQKRSDAMLKLTEKAREKIRFYLKDKDPMQWGIRIRSQGGSFGFALEEFRASSSSDQVTDLDGIKVITDRSTSVKIDEATVDFVESGGTSGFSVKLPEVPKRAPSTASGPDLSDPQVKRVQDILLREINPAIASHGGMARLVDVKDNVVYLQFGGGCHGCGMVDVTLKQGIEKRIKELMPDIIAVVDETDHAKGDNPYFHD